MTGGTRLLSACLRAAVVLTGAKAPDAAGYVEAVRREMGGPEDVALDDMVEPLDRFLWALEAEAGLSALGRYATRWDVRRLLATVVRFRAEQARDPAILAEPVERPLIITGIPRSGTTFLHRLMAEDPALRAPRVWETLSPYPAPGGADERVRRAEAELRLFQALAPGIRSIHPLSARSPQECTEITAHVFQSLRFDTTYDVPSYRSWLAARGHHRAYAFHKTFLQHLQHQEGGGRAGGRRRWVLKCPDHVFALAAVRQVYPDARFIFVHRDPAKVIPSVARLTEVLRRPFASRVDRLAIGRQVVGDWARGAAIMVALDQSGGLPPDRVLHLHYSGVVARPLETLARVYGHFGLAWTDEALEGAARFVKATPRGGYGLNNYRPEAYGITPEDLHDRFDAYRARFDIPREVPARAAA